MTHHNTNMCNQRNCQQRACILENIGFSLVSDDLVFPNNTAGIFQRIVTVFDEFCKHY